MQKNTKPPLLTQNKPQAAKAKKTKTATSKKNIAKKPQARDKVNTKPPLLTQNKPQAVKGKKTKIATSKRKAATSKKESDTLAFRVLSHLSHGQYPKQIARQLRVSYDCVRRIIKKLDAIGAIKREFRTNFVSYKLTEFGKKITSSGQSGAPSLLYVRKKAPLLKTTIRSHNFGMKFKVLKDNQTADYSKEIAYKEVKKARGRWTSKYFVITHPLGLTIEKTPGNVIIHFHKFYTNRRAFQNDMLRTQWKGMLCAMSKFQKYGVTLDVFEPEIVRFHLANERPDLNDSVTDKSAVKVDLKRKAKVIFPASFDAKAWLDRSHGDVEVETNDSIYEEKLLMMPEKVHQLHGEFAPLMAQNIEVMAAFSEQISLHLGVMTEIKSAMKDMKGTMRAIRAGVVKA